MGVLAMGVDDDSDDGEYEGDGGDEGVGWVGSGEGGEVGFHVADDGVKKRKRADDNEDENDDDGVEDEEYDEGGVEDIEDIEDDEDDEDDDDNDKKDDVDAGASLNPHDGRGSACVVDARDSAGIGGGPGGGLTGRSGAVCESGPGLGGYFGSLSGSSSRYEPGHDGWDNKMGIKWEAKTPKP